MPYCHSCDKIISKKFLIKHNKSKTHLYFYNKQTLYWKCIMERF